MNAPTTAPVILTRDEAVALTTEMQWTSGDNMVQDDLGQREVVQEAIRRMRLESAVRDAMGWWRYDGAEPAMLDIHQKVGEGECPESWALNAPAVAALVELLPALITAQNARVELSLPHWSAKELAEHEEDEGERKRVLDGIAARLGVEAVTA